MPAGKLRQRVKDGIVLRPELAMVGDEDLVPSSVQAGLERRDDLDRSEGSRPAPFAASCHRRADQPAHPLEHAVLPLGRIAAQVAALPDQPVGIPHILDAQQVHLRHS